MTCNGPTNTWAIASIWSGLPEPVTSLVLPCVLAGLLVGLLPQAGQGQRPQVRAELPLPLPPPPMPRFPPAAGVLAPAIPQGRSIPGTGPGTGPDTARWAAIYAALPPSAAYGASAGLSIG